MKQRNHQSLFIICLVLLLAASCHQASKTSEKETTAEKDAAASRADDTAGVIKDHSTNISPDTNKPAGDLDFLKTLNGKYPNDVKLFDNAPFTERLKKLTGDRYNFLRETWAVETPMEYSNDVFVASACQAHNCGSTNFIIVYDFSKNVMYAGIREEEKVKTYAEDGGTHSKITDWENGK